VTTGALLRGDAGGRLVMVKHVGLVLMLVAVAACGPHSMKGPGAQSTPVPPAVMALIQDLKTQPVANPAAYVASYDYGGQVVYYVPPRCCDIFGNLYSGDGQVICHPDGGLAGSGDGRCPDFLSQRKNEAVIWRDTRAPA
jgi:hypothetical protein